MAGHIDDSLTSMIGIRKHLIRRSLISRSVGLFPTPTRTLACSIIRSLVIATMKLEPTQGLYSCTLATHDVVRTSQSVFEREDEARNAMASSSHVQREKEDVKSGQGEEVFVFL